jgi:hypothetical protein
MEKLISTEDAAELVRLRPQTLRSLRSKGGGPVFIRLSASRCAYRPADLEQLVEERKRRSTADPGPGPGRAG